MTERVKLDDAPDVMTVDEAAAVLHIGRNAMYALIHERKVYAVRIGRRLRVPKTSLIDFLQPDRFGLNSPDGTNVFVLGETDRARPAPVKSTSA